MESVNGVASIGAAESESNSDGVDSLKYLYRPAIERAKTLEYRCQEQGRRITELEYTISALGGENSAVPITPSSVSPGAAHGESGNELQNSISSSTASIAQTTVPPAAAPAEFENDLQNTSAKEYAVDEIVDVRKGKNQMEYKVRWEGFSPVDDSWEPEDHLNCDEKIDDFWKGDGLDRKKFGEKFRAEIQDNNNDCEADAEKDDYKKDANYRFTGRLNLTETRKSNRVNIRK